MAVGSVLEHRFGWPMSGSRKKARMAPTNVSETAIRPREQWARSAGHARSDRHRCAYMNENPLRRFEGRVRLMNNARRFVGLGAVILACGCSASTASSPDAHAITSEATPGDAQADASQALTCNAPAEASRVAGCRPIPTGNLCIVSGAGKETCTPSCDSSAYELLCSNPNFPPIADGGLVEGGEASSFPTPDHSLGCGVRGVLGAANGAFYCCPCAP
jgi:hypothetical protein